MTQYNMTSCSAGPVVAVVRRPWLVTRHDAGLGGQRGGALGCAATRARHVIVDSGKLVHIHYPQPCDFDAVRTTSYVYVYIVHRVHKCIKPTLN